MKSKQHKKEDGNSTGAAPSKTSHPKHEPVKESPTNADEKVIKIGIPVTDAELKRLKKNANKPGQ